MKATWKWDSSARGEQEGEQRKDEPKTPSFWFRPLNGGSDFEERGPAEMQWVGSVALLKCKGWAGAGGWGVWLEATEKASTLYILKLSKHWSPDFHGTLRQLLGN